LTQIILLYTQSGCKLQLCNVSTSLSLTELHLREIWTVKQGDFYIPLLLYLKLVKI